MKSSRQGTVCFLIKDKQVLLALIAYPNMLKRWNGIGGYIENGESPEEAVEREVKEEIGVYLVRESLKNVTQIKVSKSLSLHVFIAREWRRKPIIIDPSIKKLKWFTSDSIPYKKMLKNNEEWLKSILDNILTEPG